MSIVYDTMKQLSTIPEKLGLEGNINKFPRVEVILQDSTKGDDKDNKTKDIDIKFDIITKHRNYSQALKIASEVEDFIQNLTIPGHTIDLISEVSTNYISEITEDDKLISRAIINNIFTVTKIANNE